MTRVNHDRYRLLFEHSSDAHFILIGDKITDCNEAAVNLIKASCKDEVLGTHPAKFSPVYQPDGTLSAQKTVEMDALARKNGYHRFEWYHQKMDGEVFPVQVTLNAIEIEGQPALIAVWHDLTDLKRKEDGLRQANEKMKKDLASAAAVQRNLLPVVSPLVKGLKASWVFKPCDELGGDMLNIFQLDEKHLGLYVLDVTGHGVAASLLSVTVSQFLSPYSGASFARNPQSHNRLAVAGPSSVAEKLNTHFTSNPDFLQLFTLLYGVFNTETCELSYICAGHPLPICVSANGQTRVLQGEGLPIGVAGDYQYVESKIRLNCGDRLFFYSDGIVEAKNAKRELLGQGRFLNLLTETHPLPLEQSLDVIVRETEAWCKPGLPSDDITLLACELCQGMSVKECSG